MKKFMFMSTLLLTNAAFAHEVSFPLLTSFYHKMVIEQCGSIGKTINERLEILLPSVTSRMKITEKRVYIGENEYREYTCVALINNIPGEATITYNLFSKSRYDRATDSCSEESDLAKSQHPKYLAVVDTISKPLIGKSKCFINVLDIVPTILN